MDQLVTTFVNALSTAKASGGNEPQIVQQFTTSVNNISISTLGKVAYVRSHFIHQNPYAFFVSPLTLHQKVKTEMGDILLVVKQKQRGVLLKARACILQVKLATGNSIALSPHQHDFQRDLHMISFRFGQRVYRAAGYQPIVWSHVTRSKRFIVNLLLYQNFDYIAYAKDIDSSLHSYNLSQPPCCRSHGLLFSDFLSSLFRFEKVGHQLTGQVKGIVDIIYRRFGWTIDPKEEWLQFFGENPGEESENEGFGIIEVTIED